MTAYGYARVSSEGQVEGSSLTTQRARILAWGPVEHVFTDPAESAATPLGERPEGRRLLAKLQPGDTVVVTKLDRAWRLARDCLSTVEAWEAQGIRLVILDLGVDTGTPMGKFFLTVAAAFAELERGLINERIRSGVAEAVQARESWGPVAPYGWRKVSSGKGPAGGRVEEVPREQEALEAARRLRARGVPWEAVLASLNDSGLTRRAGLPWTHRGDLARALRRDEAIKRRRGRA